MFRYNTERINFAYAAYHGRFGKTIGELFLDPVPEVTRVTNPEEWSGIGVLFWDYSWVEPTYKEMNEILKKQVLRTL